MSVAQPAVNTRSPTMERKAKKKEGRCIGGSIQNPLLAELGQPGEDDIRVEVLERFHQGHGFSVHGNDGVCISPTGGGFGKDAGGIEGVGVQGEIGNPKGFFDQGFKWRRGGVDDIFTVGNGEASYGLGVVKVSADRVGIGRGGVCGPDGSGAESGPGESVGRKLHHEKQDPGVGAGKQFSNRGVESIEDVCVVEFGKSGDVEAAGDFPDRLARPDVVERFAVESEALLGGEAAENSAFLERLIPIFSECGEELFTGFRTDEQIGRVWGGADPGVDSVMAIHRTGCRDFGAGLHRFVDDCHAVTAKNLFHAGAGGRVGDGMRFKEDERLIEDRHTRKLLWVCFLLSP